MARKKCKAKKHKKVKGDCLRQCVARILGRRPSTVPDFVNKYRRWRYHLIRWLARRKLLAIFVDLKDHRMRVSSPTHPHHQFIRIGKTKHNSYHAVVACSITGLVTYDGGNPLKSVETLIFIVRPANNTRGTRTSL